MSYQSPYQTFVFERYDFDTDSNTATFHYSFDETIHFSERVHFVRANDYDVAALDRALQLSFVLAGVSYYKAFPTKKVVLKTIELDAEQAAFFTAVYQSGLSQFVYENNIDPADIARFEPTTEGTSQPTNYSGEGIMALQSGGKDSLLMAELLAKKGVDFTPWYISQVDTIPAVLQIFQHPLRHAKRDIDIAALTSAKQNGGLNGHVPITFIVLSFALIDAILLGKSTILMGIGHEGEEPHAMIGDYPVTHQWSKTWRAEQLFQEYVQSNISPALRVGSPLRGYSELKIARLFVEHAWEKYGHSFSSCNVANYRQGHDNSQLSWCGDCPKCANSYLLFAAFVEPSELYRLFGGNLFEKQSLQADFKGLLGVDGAMKPFECVGEVDELRKAYELALARGYAPLAFAVEKSNFNIDTVYDAQDWAVQMIQ